MKLFFKQHRRSSDKRKSGQFPPVEKRPTINKGSIHTFCTNSKYEGTWDSIGMRGYGSYYLFYGVDYDGDFFDSTCHERGTLVYPNNAKMDGFWDNGHMIAHRYFFTDNLCYGPYCEMPDRRFYLEVKEKLNPAGRSFLTNSFETREIPAGCYDTGDGFYDPKKKCVFNPNDLTQIIRIPNKDEHEWIINHCRKAWDEPVGYNPNLYENWYQEDEASRSNLIRKSIDYLCYRRNKISNTDSFP